MILVLKLTIIGCNIEPLLASMLSRLHRELYIETHLDRKQQYIPIRWAFIADIALI